MLCKCCGEPSWLLVVLAHNNWLCVRLLSTCVPHGRQFNTEPSVIQGQPPHPAGFSAAAEQLSTLQLWSAVWAGVGRSKHWRAASGLRSTHRHSAAPTLLCSDFTGGSSNSPPSLSLATQTSETKTEEMSEVHRRQPGLRCRVFC